jgi:hypothetical protein
MNRTTPEGKYKAKDNGVKKKIGRSFYRGESVNFNPYLKDFIQEDFLDYYLFKGWKPENKIITKDTKVTAFGSCFASNIANHLSTAGYSLSKDEQPDIYISSMGEGLVNTFSLLQQFEWALENKTPTQELWHGYKAEDYGYSEEIKEKTKSVFLNTEFFIITLGLSEIWYDEITGEVFWRAVPQDKVDPSRHKFRVCTLAETKENLQKIYNLIRKHIPNAKLLFTLSPVPLAATFRPVSCMSANSVSKSILRAALDEFYRDNWSDLNTKLFYFPSYEIVTELFFQKFKEDNRHPKDEIIEMIMKLFEYYYCDTVINNVEELYKQLRKDNQNNIIL